jgi:hypothetical protein
MSSPWEGKVRELIWTLDDDNPRYRHGKWRAVFDDQLKSTPLTIQSANPLFSLPLGEGRIGFTKWLSKEAIWDRIQTLSQVAIQEGEQREVSEV